MGWLTFLSAAIPPIGGIIIADFLRNREKYKDFANAKFDTVNWAAILGVAIGVAAGHLLPGIVPINAVLAGALSYLVIDTLIKRKTVPSKSTCKNATHA